MNIQYPRHMHTPNWEQSNSTGKKKEIPNANSLPNNQQDSLLYRVFGHHSSESSRAPSPVSSTKQTQPKSASRHGRNSSTGAIPISITSPCLPQANSADYATLHRRRSFDEQTLGPDPILFSQEALQAPIPFPRGGRQIGTDQDSQKDTQMQRSHSSDRSLIMPVEQPTKKRHFFRIGKKKNASSASSVMTQSTTASSTTLSNSPAPRKKSNGIDPKQLLDYSAAMDVQKNYLLQQDRKKYTNRKGKQDTRPPLAYIKLDQDFGTMEGIVNPDYYKLYPGGNEKGFNPAGWPTPDSWGVQTRSMTPGIDDDEEFQPKKNAKIRIYRPDQTYNTLHVPTDITTENILLRLKNKMFLPDMDKHHLVMKLHNRERVLGLKESPVAIQREFQEQMGYTDNDKNDDISYLIRFQLWPVTLPPFQLEKKDFGSHVDLQSRLLSTLPGVLYKHAPKIVSLDVSKNLHIEITVDFANVCTNIQHLSLVDNKYGVLPASIRLFRSLEHLNVSGNQLANLDHAHLESLSRLQTLRAVNNQLKSLPAFFATAYPHLTSLFLSNNALTDFPRVLCDITSLAYLDISFNKISSFPEEMGRLTHLVGLYAMANVINTGLPPSFLNLTKLKELDIRQNLITDLDVVSHLPTLEILLVDYNSTSIVHFEITSLKQLKMYKNHLTQFNLSSAAGVDHLTELNLSNCKLSSLPEDLFKNTLSLEHLVLDSNTLTTLPLSIGVLQRLTQLSIHSNYLEILPAEIGRLCELKVLDAQKNNLKSLPKEIWSCASLQTLNCSSNLLDSFPEPFSGGENHLCHSGELATLSNAQLKRMDSPQTPLESSPSFNFNPPSFFESPRNHPPALSLSLQYLFLGDNRLTDDIWPPLSLFSELRTLNLAFNDLYEVPPGGLCHKLIYELYLSGNQLTSLPADDIVKLQYLRVLAVNGNKLQTLPAEIGKLRKLLVLDVSNNILKYNIANWPYDWNWNWNLGLKYLNLSGNKRLEIQKTHPDPNDPKKKNLSDFSALTRLRMLGLMDITILGVMIPDESPDRRVRTSLSEVNSMSYGIADWLGPYDHLSTWDLVVPRFRLKEDECVFALFDGYKRPITGCPLTKQLYDLLSVQFSEELNRITSEDTIVSTIRRTFLNLQQILGSSPHIDKDLGASAAMCYLSGTKLYVANVGDTLAIISRNNGQAFEITQKHIPLNPAERWRVQAAGGYVSNTGKLNHELSVSRGFGHFHLVPLVNCNPFVSTIDLSESDEFVIMASHGLWDKITYQTAVDIARTEKDDLMAAAQKLRDFAITYGAADDLMVMVIGVGDLFDKREKRSRKNNLGPGRAGPDSVTDEGMLVKSSKRRGKEEIPADSTLARLEREVAPPVSQLALVFTDIKSSTQFWETQPENMRAGIKLHDAIMRRTLRSAGGYEVKTEGDAFMVCFKNITAALLWCFTVQIQLLEADWPAGIIDSDEGRAINSDDGALMYKGLSVRMGIHWGTPVSERNPITQRMDYFGPVVNKASRICNVADGGQICVSSDVIDALRNFPSMFSEDADLAESSSGDEGSFPVSRDLLQLKKLGFHIVELGERRLKGLETPETLCLVYPKQLLGRIEIDQMMATENNLILTPPPEQTEPACDFLAIQPKVRTIDPNLVCAMSNLAIRLERLTSGHALSQSMAGSSILSQYTYGSQQVQSTNQTSFGLIIERHIREEATDEELMAMMENCVTRVENATSALYLQKMGRFANVLEKLGESIQVDPTHILKALQMYAEVMSNTF
ncbi:hypothetical protein BY458DRAFT_501237 [Sporodiniella umbellata]|nr:hypothetical protein BY458DRAFT_501237 [Sporodiniella umbellata]